MRAAVEVRSWTAVASMSQRWARVMGGCSSSSAASTEAARGVAGGELAGRGTESKTKSRSTSDAF